MFREESNTWQSAVNENELLESLFSNTSTSSILASQTPPSSSPQLQRWNDQQQQQQQKQQKQSIFVKREFEINQQLDEQYLSSLDSKEFQDYVDQLRQKRRLNEDEEGIIKRVNKKIHNRESARKSRQTKKENCIELDTQILALSQQSQSLKEEANVLYSLNQQIRSEIAFSENLIASNPYFSNLYRKTAMELQKNSSSQPLSPTQYQLLLQKHKQQPQLQQNQQQQQQQPQQQQPQIKQEQNTIKQENQLKRGLLSASLEDILAFDKLNNDMKSPLNSTMTSTPSSLSKEECNSSSNNSTIVISPAAIPPLRIDQNQYNINSPQYDIEMEVTTPRNCEEMSGVQESCSSVSYSPIKQEVNT